MDAPNIRPNLTYPITNPNTGEQHLPPRGRHWRISPEKFASALEDNRIIWGKSGTGRPQLKVFYDEKKDYGSIDNSWFTGDKIGTATEATRELQSLFKNAPFDTPKPILLIRKLCELGFVERNDIILDFFSGSATTAHAVMQLNAEDGGKRKFIMVQLPEVCPPDSEAAKAHYKNICEIGKERIRRAGKKIKEEKPLTTQDLDIGFRVLKVKPSCMADVYYTPDATKQQELSLFDNIKTDATPEDLLFQVLTDWGVELHLPIAPQTIKGKKVFFVDQNSLAACFDSGINEDFIKELAAHKPLRVVFRDAGFASDAARINAEQIFKQLSPDTEVRVL